MWGFEKSPTLQRHKLMADNKTFTTQIGSAISVQNQLTLFACFGMLLGYIFLILFIQSIVSVISFNVISIVLPASIIADHAVIVSNLLSRFFGLVAAAYFVLLMARRYFSAPTISLVFGQIGLVPCSIKWAAVALTLGIMFSIIFEYWLPRRYPADPIILENLGAQLSEASVWQTIFLLVITVGITPIVEETFFRGLLYEAFSISIGKMSSALIVTVIFVLLHYQAFSYWVALASLLAGSITLIVVREVSASLIPSILLHQIYNLGVAIFSE